MPTRRISAVRPSIAAALRSLREFGTEREHRGRRRALPRRRRRLRLLRVLDGEVEIVRPDVDGDVVIVEHAAGGSSAS